MNVRGHGFRTNLGPFIAEEWEADYPDFWERLNQDGLVARYADQRADHAAELFAKARVNRVSCSEAYRYAAIAWRSPQDDYARGARQ